MGKFSDILKGGALGIGPAILARNPKMLRGLGVLGNVAANQIENREDDKKRAQSAATEPTPQNEVPVAEENSQKLFKKGGKVKSASSRADGVAQRGKTRGKMY
jgi:hypothetical protein